jgi:hypothetical protein
MLVDRLVFHPVPSLPSSLSQQAYLKISAAPALLLGPGFFISFSLHSYTCPHPFRFRCQVPGGAKRMLAILHRHCYVKHTIIPLIYLFKSRESLRDMWRKEITQSTNKGNQYSALGRYTRTKETLHLRRCAVRKSRGTSPPDKETQEKEQIIHRPEGLSRPKPPTRPFVRHERHPHLFHQPSLSPPPTALGTLQTAAPSGIGK